MSPQTNDLKPHVEAILANLNPMQHLHNLNFPRRSGTEGEQQAAAYIAATLEGYGYTPSVQEFNYARAGLRSKIVPPLVFLAWLALSLVNVRFWDGNPFVALVVLALPLALFLAIPGFGQVMRYFSTQRMRELKKLEQAAQEGRLNSDQVIASRNVIATSGPEDAPHQILFTAHFDSISARLPMRVMTISITGVISGLIFYSLFYLDNVLLRPHVGSTYLPFFAILAAFLAVCLAIFFTTRSLRGNESHGSIDDGTGVAILLELAKFAQQHPIPGYQLIFGFYGSEEAGLIGSTWDYLHRTIDPTRLRVISVDMIGEKPPLAYVKGLSLIRTARMDPAFNEQIVTLANALEIKIEGKKFPYPGSDFAPFMLEGGCKANWFINSSRWIHSRHDRLDKVNPELVQDALKLIVAYLLQTT